MLEETVTRLQVEELKVPEPEDVRETTPVGVNGVPVPVSVIVTVQVDEPSIESVDGVQVTAVVVGRVLTKRVR